MKRRITIKSYIYLTRQQLYQEVWDTSIRGVAQKYNLNYDNLFRKFRDEKIPHPDNSYLVKKSNGEDAPAPVEPLEGNPDKIVKLLSNDDIPPAQFSMEDRSQQLKELQAPQKLDFLKVSEKQNVIFEISNITVNQKDAPSSAVVGYIDLNRRKFSPHAASRAEQILSALVTSLVHLGAKTRSISEQGYFLTYRDVTLQIQMKERTTQYKRSLKAMDENPDIPRFEQRFNGRLELNLHGKVFADEDDYTLEYQLGRILQSAVEITEEIRSKSSTALRSSQEKEDAYREIAALYRDADAHARAKQIRAYVEDVLLEHFDNPEIRKWAKWALEQADQLDPPPAKFDH